MSNKINVTAYRNNVRTKDGAREIIRVRAWDAITQEDGNVTFKLKLSAGMSLPVGEADKFEWERVINEETGEIRTLKCKLVVYGQIGTDKAGGLWLNPFNAVRQDDGKWKVVDRNHPEGKPMVFQLAPWTGEKKVAKDNMISVENNEF